MVYAKVCFGMRAEKESLTVRYLDLIYFISFIALDSRHVPLPFHTERARSVRVACILYLEGYWAWKLLQMRRRDWYITGKILSYH